MFLLVACILGAILSQIAVLGVWIALGRSPIMWRVIFGLLGSSSLALLFCMTIGEMEAEWFGLAWSIVAVVAGLFVFVRRIGFRLVNINTDVAPSSGQLQFSIQQVMVLMTVVASLAAVGRLLAPTLATLSQLMLGLAIAVCLGVVTLAAVWATLGREDAPSRMKGFLIFTGFTAGLVYYVMETTQADPGLIWATIVVAYASSVAGTLSLVRSRGFRVIRTTA